MKFLKAEQIRNLDKRMIQERKCAGMMLMHRAGLAVAQVIAQLATVRNEHRRVTFVAGKGNNGGDALVAARHLYESGWHVGVLLTCLPAKLEGDAYEAWNDLHAAGIVHQVFADARDWEDTTGEGKGSARLPITGIIVDGLLGTGAVAGDAVTADITVTFAYPKAGFLNPVAQSCIGHVVVADIGIHENFGAEAEREAEERIQLIAAPELNGLLPIRQEFAHKRLFGHVGVIAGARGYSGAPALTVAGALRAGAGLITAAVPPEAITGLAAHTPEAMAYPLDAPDGVITVSALERWGRSLDDFDCLALGPGMTAADTTRDVVQWVLDRYDGRVVLDADALNVLPRVTLRKPERLILTPHTGEAARLLGLTPATVQADRLGAVRALAVRFGGTVVLKGAGTLVCEAAGDPWITFTGNPGMATGGSGDVLTGIIAAMAARPMAAFDAARLGVWLHGTAGDFAMWRESQEALTALDITRSLSHAFAMLRNA